MRLRKDVKAITESFEVEMVARLATRPNETKIFSEEGREVGTLQKGLGLTLVLTEPGEKRWVLDPRVMGHVQPFSMTIREDKGGGERGSAAKVVLTIRQGLFQHGSKSYMFSGVPSGVDPRQFLVGKRYICRLDDFRLDGLQSLDWETIGRLRRYFRGV